MPMIILLGVCPSDACDDNEMDKRCQLAAQIWRGEGNARIIACGGAQTDDVEPEAILMRQRLIGLGVAAADILLENQSKTTMENLRFAAKLLDESDRRELFVVTSDYHTARARLIARRVGLSVRTHGAKTRFSAKKLRRIILEILSMIDIILGFEDPGAQSPAWRNALLRLLGQVKP